MATRAKPQAKRTAAPRATSARRGRPPWEPNDEQRKVVSFLAGHGSTQETIASVMGTTVDTLAKHCRAELDAGMDVAHALVAGALMQQILNGSTAGAIWYEKTRCGRREVTTHEHSGPNGAPIEHRDMSGYTDEQLAVLEQAAALLGAGTGDDSGES